MCLSNRISSAIHSSLHSPSAEEGRGLKGNYIEPSQVLPRDPSSRVTPEESKHVLHV
jgi:hypothetical protein